MKDYIIVLQDMYCEIKNNLTNWSRNKKIDDFIQKMQLEISEYNNVVEWIPYNQFVNIKKIGKDDDNIATMYLAIWSNGSLYFDKEKWMRKSNEKVALKSLDSSQNMIDELLNEV